MIRKRWWKLVYDGDDSTTTNPPPPPAKKVFTQEDIDRIAGEERRKAKERSDRLAVQLEDLQKKAGLSQQEKDDLQQQIESLRTEHLTKEEQIKAEHDKIIKKTKADTDSLLKDRDSWKDRYTTSEIRRSIQDASTVEKARSSKPIVALLQPLTFLASVIDADGKPTGDLVPKVKWTEVKEGKTLTLELSVHDAVKKMKENEEYFHLFEGTATSGIGGSSRSAQGSNDYDPEKPPSDPAKFRAWRQKRMGRTK